MRNSRLLFILFAGISLLNNATAQDDSDFRTKVTGGFKLGLNVSNVYDVEGDDFEADAKVGFVGGGFLSIPIGRFLGIQPEVLYSQKGFRADGSFIGNNYSVTRTLNYLDIPIFIALKPLDRVTILAGPQFSYLMSRNDRFTNNSFSSFSEQNFANDNIRRNTVCFVGGLDINANHFVIGGRIGWDLFNNTGDGNSTSPRYKNIWGQATLGYRF